MVTGKVNVEAALDAADRLANLAEVAIPHVAALRDAIEVYRSARQPIRDSVGDATHL